MDVVPLLKPYAYLDPGSGSVILQVILAGLLGVGVMARIFRRKISALLNRILGREQPNFEDEEQR